MGVEGNRPILDTGVLVLGFFVTRKHGNIPHPLECLWGCTFVTWLVSEGGSPGDVMPD